jgi:hypothetical protein
MYLSRPSRPADVQKLSGFDHAINVVDSSPRSPTPAEFGGE